MATRPYTLFTIDDLTVTAQPDERDNIVRVDFAKTRGHNFIVKIDDDGTIHNIDTRGAWSALEQTLRASATRKPFRWDAIRGS